jgi:Lrp/AsnC family transcriptional regulator for asnA, asnC and gidA
MLSPTTALASLTRRSTADELLESPPQASLEGRMEPQPPVHIDEVDRRIVAALIANGRTSAAQIARAVGEVTERAVRYRLQRLMDRGVLRVSAIVDPRAVGYEVIADVFIEVAAGELRRVAERLVEHERVSYVAASIGQGDLSVQVCARDSDELAAIVTDLVASIAGVKKAQTVLVSWKLKDVYQWQIPPGVVDGDIGGIARE